MYSFILYLSLCGAPAPLPRPPVLTPVKPTPESPYVLGPWRMTWGSRSGPAVFRHDGTLDYLWGGDPYLSRWRVVGDELRVWDSNCAGPRPSAARASSETPSWSARLRRCPTGWEGNYCGTTVRLEPLK